MSTITDRIEQLRSLGVGVTNDRYWKGRVGQGRSDYVLPGTVEYVTFPFTPDDWVRMCMRDIPQEWGESQYVGGCCGNMSAVQDIANEAFRDGGGCKLEHLETMGHYLRRHDGWEPFAKEFDLDAALDPARWAEPPEGKRWNYLYQEDDDQLPARLDPWAKICVIHAALEPVLRLERTEMPRVDEVRDKDAEAAREFRQLYAALSRIEWSDLFGYNSNTEGTSEENRPYIQDRDDSRLVNRKVAMAKVLPPTRNLLTALESITETFDGYGLVKPGTDEVLSNMNGLCLFPARDGAERLTELWTNMARNDAESKARHELDHANDEWDGEITEDDVQEYFEAPEAEIVRVTVSVEEGLRVHR